MARDWSTLGCELLLQIMQQLPQEDRLRAGLCCSTWRAAANAATGSVQLFNRKGPRALALVPWLQQHGPQITSMQIKLHNGIYLGHLPCNNLRELIVGEDSYVHLPILPPAAVTSLTSLILQATSNAAPVLVSSTNSQLSAYQQLLQELRGFTRLQHLCLGMDGCASPSLASEDVWDALQCLQRLTRLEVRHMFDVMHGCKARISSLTNLQALVLEFCEETAGAADDCFDGMQHLQALTELKLSGEDERHIEGIQHISKDSIGRLTGLRRLHLHYCTWEPAALSAVAGLHDVTLDAYADPTALLAWLQQQQQQQLTRLCLEGSFDPRVTGHPLPDDDAFGAITASTALQELDIKSPLLKAAWLHMFPANRQLPQLTSLRAPCQAFDSTLLDAADVSALVRCCPALQVLEAGGILRLEPQLSSLQHLTRLEVIDERLAPGDDEAAAAALTALHRLQQLRLCGSPGMDITQLSKPMADAVTQLTGLVRLELLRLSLSEQQLSSLSGLTRMTHLTFHPNKLGELLLARLESVCSNISRYPSYYRTVTLEFAPRKAPRDGPSELTQHLLKCFTHEQVWQELTSLRQKVAQQQQQITELTAHKS